MANLTQEKPKPARPTRQKFSAKTAIAIVIANMVGTGVFTSLGYQLVDIRSSFVILMLWVLGGCAALCGALSYAELSVRFPRSGGEYNFLRQIYHPAVGFVSGWVSALVGFAAPTALVAMTFATYLGAAVQDSLTLHREATAIALVLSLTLFHCRSTTASSSVQNIFTLLKIVLIIGFCGLVSQGAANPQVFSFMPLADDFELLTSGAFAISLIYVNYAYTGWNAATYVISEIAEPRRSVPLVLVGGTLIVMVLYIMLNTVFLYAAPMEAMTGKIEIGVIVAETVYGKLGALVMGIVLSLLLVSTASAMIIAGPRVLQVIDEDFAIFKWLAKRNSEGVPNRSVLLQSLLSVIFILTATFESILIFSGFVLALSSMLTVAGVYVLRFKDKAKSIHPSYRTLGYPVTPLIYLGITLWTLVFILLNRPLEAGLGLVVILVGLLLFLLLGRYSHGQPH